MGGGSDGVRRRGDEVIQNIDSESYDDEEVNMQRDVNKRITFSFETKLTDDEREKCEGED